MSNREKTKLGYAAKANILGEKFAWFTEHLDEKQDPLTPEEFVAAIEQYLNRFEEEIDQIKLKQSISKSRSHQHFSREATIRMTIEKETSDFNGGGIQFMDLCDLLQFRAFKDWDGNSMSLQHFKLQLISRNFIENKSKMAT